MPVLTEGVQELFYRGIKFGNTAPTTVVMGGGSTTDPVSTDVASKNFIGFWTKSTGTGTSRGAYLRHYIAKAAADGECLRVFTTVKGVAAGGGVHGAHVTASLDATGSTTGLLVGLRATIAADAATRSLGGNLAALQVSSDIGANNTLPGTASFIRVSDDNTVKIKNFLHIANTGGCLKGSAATGAATDALAVLMPDGSTLYVSLIAAA